MQKKYVSTLKSPSTNYFLVVLPILHKEQKIAKSEGEKKVEAGLGVHIILGLSVIIEGYLKNTLDSIASEIFLEINQDIESYKRSESFVKFIKSSIASSSWNKLSTDLSKTLTNKKISEIIPNECNKGINSIFQVRNILAHGSYLSITENSYTDGKKESYFDKRSAFDVLIENELLLPVDLNNNQFDDIFSIEIVDFYLNISIVFFESISNVNNSYLDREKYRIPPILEIIKKCLRE